MRRLKAIFFALGFAPFLVSAQGLEVWIDLSSDSVFYRKNGKSVERPRLRAGQELTVRAVELNPYIYDAALESRLLPAEKVAAGPSVSSLTNGFLPKFGGASGGLMGAFFKKDSSGAGEGRLSILNIPFLRIGEHDLSLGSFFKNSRGSEAVVAEAGAAAREVAESVEDFRKNWAELQQLERSAAVSRLVVGQAEGLRFRADLKPSTIKKLTAEQYRLLFRKAAGEAPSVEDALGWQDLPAEMAARAEAVRSGHSLFLEKTKRLTAVAGQIEGLESVGDAAFLAFSEDLRKAQKQAREVDFLWKRAATEGENFSKKADLPTAAAISEAQLLMLSTLENSFSKTFKIRLEDGATEAQLRLFSKKATGDTSSKRAAKTVVLRFETSGGLRIRAGAGLCFGQFSSPTEAFGVKNGLIVAEEGDVFAPSVASMVHFYGTPRAGRSALGGSIGAGFPIQAGEKKALRFFVGPTLMFGRGGRAAITAGAMLGQTERLARGFAVGDAFDLSLGDIPTRARWEMGWFVGASFGFSAF